MNFSLGRRALVAMWLSLLAGCPAAQTPRADNDVTGNIDSGATPAPAKTVGLAIKSWPEIERHIQGKKGQIVVVDLWSTTCEPCMREFPHLVALARKYPQIACISVSTDFYGDPIEPPESFRANVLNFLVEQQATFDNFLASDSSDEVMQQVGAVAVPVVLIYDAQGNLHQRFPDDDQDYGEEGFTYADHIEPVVAELTK